MSEDRPCVYSLWLGCILDLTDKPTSDMLQFMSSFDSLQHKSLGILLRYARCWCILSNFLYDNREKQLSSDKLQMLFCVEERQQDTDVYWFEVLRACGLLANETLLNVLQDMRILRCMAEKRSFAEIALQLDDDLLSSALINIKWAIGICNYSLRVAALHCKSLQTNAPRVFAAVSLHYQCLRIMGCFIQALHQLRTEGTAQDVTRWLCTVEQIAKQHTGVGLILSCVLESTQMLKLYAFAQQSLREGQRGLAMGFAGAAQQAASKSAHAGFAQKLQEDMAPPPKAVAPPVPPSNSALLTLPCLPHDKALELGTSPFVKNPAIATLSLR